KPDGQLNPFLPSLAPEKLLRNRRHQPSPIPAGSFSINPPTMRQSVQRQQRPVHNLPRTRSPGPRNKTDATSIVVQAGRAILPIHGAINTYPGKASPNRIFDAANANYGSRGYGVLVPDGTGLPNRPWFDTPSRKPRVAISGFF